MPLTTPSELPSGVETCLLCIAELVLGVGAGEGVWVTSVQLRLREGHRTLTHHMQDVSGAVAMSGLPPRRVFRELPKPGSALKKAE